MYNRDGTRDIHGFPDNVNEMHCIHHERNNYARLIAVIKAICKAGDVKLIINKSVELIYLYDTLFSGLHAYGCSIKIHYDNIIITTNDLSNKTLD